MPDATPTKSAVPKSSTTAGLSSLNVKSISQRISSSFAGDQKKKLESIASSSVKSLKAGDSDKAVKLIDEFNRTSVLFVQNDEGEGTSPWVSCGDHCQHHLDAGDIAKIAKYGVCYWACVIRGGPEAKT